MDDREVLAIVGNRKITESDVEELLKSLAPQTAVQLKSGEGVRKLVKELVNQELLYLDALENGLDREDSFNSEIEKAKASILKQYALNRLVKNIVITENDLVSFYNANKSDFSVLPSVHAGHILVDSENKAGDIFDKIRSGLPFEEAAKKFSSCPSRDQGGDLGYFSQGMMVPEFEEAAFATEVNDIGGPVKTQFGYHLIKVYDKRGESVKPLDEVREEIFSQLAAQKRQELYQQKINELRKKYSVTLFV